MMKIPQCIFFQGNWLCFPSVVKTGQTIEGECFTLGKSSSLLKNDNVIAKVKACLVAEAQVRNWLSSGI